MIIVLVMRDRFIPTSVVLINRSTSANALITSFALLEPRSASSFILTLSQDIRAISEPAKNPCMRSDTAIITIKSSSDNGHLFSHSLNLYLGNSFAGYPVDEEYQAPVRNAVPFIRELPEHIENKSRDGLVGPPRRGGGGLAGPPPGFVGPPPP